MLKKKNNNKGSIFSRIANAESSSYRYLGLGTGVFEVQDIQFTENWKGEESFTIGLVATDNVDMQDHDGIEIDKGDVIYRLIKLSNTIAGSLIKKFLMAVTGYEEEELTEEAIEEMMSSKQPLAGALVKAKGYSKEVDCDDGKTREYTNFKWYSVE